MRCAGGFEVVDASGDCQAAIGSRHDAFGKRASLPMNTPQYFTDKATEQWCDAALTVKMATSPPR